MLELLVTLLVLAVVTTTVLVAARVRRRRPLAPPRPGGTTAPPRPVEKPRPDAQGVLDLMRPAGSPTTAPPSTAPPTTPAEVPVEVAPLPELPVEVAPLPELPAEAAPRPEVPTTGAPPRTDIAEVPIEPAPVPPAAVALEPAAAPLEVPEPTAARMVRLRSRLARSQSTLGRGLLSALSRDALDDEAWDDVETALLSSDIGVGPTMEIVAALRTRVQVLGTRSPDALRAMLREELVTAIGDLDRSLRTLPSGDRPAIVLVVGVNATGKTTTCGKLARVLVADGRSVVLGAADTFRAAAADQLATWAGRVGAEVVRGPEGSDPAAVAYDAVRAAHDRRSDTVLIDTAGRLHTKTGLMDELAKIKRVAERLGSIDEVLLVLDATTGQNGIVQAKQFAAAVGVTGVVLTKLDGTAKGGIVVAVQRELGIPVKLIGLGEGPDDLAPFAPDLFVDALLADDLG